MDEEGGRPGAGTRHETPPPAGAAAGGRARTIAPYAAPPNGATLKDNNTGLDGGQDNGESSDAAQQHGTTPGTASAVFNSLGYAMAGETKTPRQPVQVNNESESKASTLSRQDTGELGNMVERLDTTLGTASATVVGPSYVNDAPERETPTKLRMTCGKSTEETHRNATSHGPVSTVLDANGVGRTTIREYEAGFNLLDTDGDGAITREEFNCASGAPFAMLDKVNDGPVLRAEGNAGFDYFDTVKNGYITAKEFSAGAHPGFVLDALDRDGNGKITREEYNADLNADLVFESLNIDGDGHITQTEYNKGSDILDKDKNDFLTRGEFGIDKSKITKRNEFHPVSGADLVFELLVAQAPLYILGNILQHMNRPLKAKEGRRKKPGRPNIPGTQQEPDVRSR